MNALQNWMDVARSMWMVALVVLLIGHGAPAAGTEVVIYRTCDALTIGADSRVIGDNAPCGATCKLIPCGTNFIAASTGLVAAEDFSLASIIEQACRDASTLSGTSHLFMDLLASAIRQRNKQFPPPDDGGAIFWVVFAGMEGSVPAYITVDARDGGNGVQLNVNPFTECTPGKYDRFANGRTAAVDGVGQAATETADAYVLRLLSIEAAATYEVGAPFDLLRIDRDGKHWLQLKPECQDEKKRPPGPVL